MDPSLPGDGEPRTKLPEEVFNIAILCTAFFYKVMNGLGTLATIWATVVLLGGFADKIKQQDFWYITIIAFVQSIGILGGYEDEANQIFMRAAEALIKDKKAADTERRISWWRRRSNPRQQQPEGTERTSRQVRKQHEDEKKWNAPYPCRTYLGAAIYCALRLGQVAAVTTCVVLSCRRLREQNYIDEGVKYITYRNIKRSLNIFYSLVLAQGIFFIIILLNPLLLLLMFVVRRKYRLFEPSGLNIILRYKHDHYLQYIIGNVRATLNMDLITFAKKLALSDSLDDKLVGIRAIDRILRSVKYRSLALMRLRASLDSDALGKLVDMLGLARAPEEQDIRGHAARVVLELAPELLVEAFPQILYLISCSLLNTANMKTVNMDVDLIWFGLRILDKLMDNPDNCRQAKDAGYLLSKIIDLTNLCGHERMHTTISDSWVEQEMVPLLQSEEGIPPHFIHKIDQQIIVGMSLRILRKLLDSIPDEDAGKELRRKISRCVPFFSNTGMILQHVEATRVIAYLALNKTERQNIGRSPDIIKKLKDCLLSKTPQVNITKVAAKLLLLDYTTSEQLSKIHLFRAENRILEDQRLLPISAFIEEVDLGPLIPNMQIIIQKLDLEDVLLAPSINHSEAAAEAFVVLTTECEGNVAAILEEISPPELKMIVKMLSSKDGDKKTRMLAQLQGRCLHPEMLRIVTEIICAVEGEYRSMVPKFLQNLRAYSGTKSFSEHMQVIDDAFETVLISIVDEVVKLENAASTRQNLPNTNDQLRIKQGKLLENFIGLAVQICASPNASDFNKTLESAKLSVDTFLQKLKKILDVYKSPTTDFPGIRRWTVELMIWMIQSNSSYIEIFLRDGVYEQLKEVARTPRKYENLKLFYCDTEIGQHSTDISSLARGLMDQLARSPNFQERYHSYGEHAGNITVLVA